MIISGHVWVAYTRHESVMNDNPVPQDRIIGDDDTRVDYEWEFVEGGVSYATLLQCMQGLVDDRTVKAYLVLTPDELSPACGRGWTIDPVELIDGLPDGYCYTDPDGNTIELVDLIDNKFHFRVTKK